MVYVQPSICPGEWDTQTPLEFCHTNRSPNLGQSSRPYNNQNKKRIWKIVDFAVPANHRVKLKESEKKDKYLDLARELKKTVEHESDDYTKWNWCFWYSHQRIGKGDGGFGTNRTSGDHTDDSIVWIENNTEKSPGDLRRIAAIQISVKDHADVKNYQGVNNNNNNDNNNNNGICSTQHLS